MRVQASLQFSCAKTGRNLETQLGTETRNLVVLQRGNLPMRCAFCGRQHYWRLIKYHHADMKPLRGVRSTVAKRHDVMTSEMLTAAKPIPAVIAKAKLTRKTNQRAIATSR